MSFGRHDGFTDNAGTCDRLANESENAMNIAPASQSIADGRRTGVAPRIMPDTELGKHAVSGYSRYLGIFGSGLHSEGGFAADLIRRGDRSHRLGLALILPDSASAGSEAQEAG